MYHTSDTWRYFVLSEDNLEVSCKECNKHFKYHGSTTVMREHLRRRHQITLKKSTGQKIKSVQQSNQLTDDSKNDDPLLPVGQFQMELTEMAPDAKMFPFLNSVAQNKPVYTSTSDRLLAKMLITNLLPVSFVEDESFRSFVHSIKSNYDIPSKDHFQTQLFPSLHSQVSDIIHLQFDVVKFVSISTEYWTTSDSLYHITITAHCIYQNKFCQSVLETVSLDDNSPERIASTLSDVFKQWYVLDKVFVIITGNEPNVKSAVTDVLKKEHVPCLATLINKTVFNAIQQCVELRDLLQKCQEISSSLFCDDMNSLMLNPKSWIHFYNQAKQILQLLEEYRRCSEIAGNEGPLTDSMPECFADFNFTILDDCIIMLGHIEETLLGLFNGETYSHISMAIPIIKGLLHVLNGLSPATQCGVNLKESLLTLIKTNFGDLESNPVVAKSTFLDPRFKSLAFNNENLASVENQLQEELKEFFTEKSTDQLIDEPVQQTVEVNDNSIWSLFDSKIGKSQPSQNEINCRLQLKNYIELPLVDRRKSPLEYPQNIDHILPELIQLKTKYLSVPSTSMSADHVFPVNGIFNLDRRNQLTGKMLDKLIFLNRNLHYLDLW